MSTHEERIRRLECETRIWRIAAVALGVMAFTGPFAAPGVSREKGTTLKAPLTVVDGSGATVLTVDAFSTPKSNALVLVDPITREPGILVATGPDRAMLALMSRKGEPVASLDASAAGGSVTVSHDDGRTAMLSTYTGGTSLKFRDANKQTIVNLGAAEHGGVLGLQYENGKDAIALRTQEKDASAAILNRSGQVVFVRPE